MAPTATKSMDAPSVRRRRDAHAASATTRRCRRGLGLLSLALVLPATLAAGAQAAPVGLGTNEAFAVLGHSTVTNTGPSVINGDVGLSPGTSVTGFPPGVVNGTFHVTDGVALQAQNDLTTAYNDAAGRPSTSTISNNLAGRTLPPGVYTASSTMGLSGDLTLDAQGDPNAVFVFKVGSGLTVGSGSRVLLINGAQSCNVNWQVGSSAVIGSSARFVGNILAMQSITMNTGATLDGRTLARNAAVTLDTNTIIQSPCSTPGDGSDGGGGTGGGGGGTGGGGSGGGGTGGGTPGDGTGTGAGTGPNGGPGSPPTVTTNTPTPVACDYARLTGRVRTGSTGSRYYFQYGRTRSYGTRTSSGRVGPNNNVRVGRTVRSLRQGVVYHYRLVGVGDNGRRSFGADRRFRTCERPRRNPARPPTTIGGFTG
jgi:hypothetical protein